VKRITIHTDGACLGNPGPGGWAAVLQFGKHRKEISGGEAFTTNNRMELRGAIEALRALSEPCKVELFTDSSYLRLGITQWIQRWCRNGWQTAGKKPVKNRDLWEGLQKLAERHEISWHWLKGHAGHPENERCDELARNQAMRLQSIAADPG